MDIELVAKWKSTGLLSKCNTEVEQIVLCSLLEECTLYMIENRVSKFTAGLLLPTVTRIYYDSKKSNINLDDVCKIIESYNLLEEGMCALDYEVEACSKATDEYVKRNMPL